LTDARLWHPWLRINRVLRVILQTRWSAEAWAVVALESAFGPQQKPTTAPKPPQYNVIWEPASAHETLKTCYDAMGVVKALLPYVKYFKCLPDGTDPRGPKGR